LEAIANDIALAIERKQGEDSLKENEEKYRLLMENSGAGVGYYDLNGNVLLFNR